MTKMKLIEIEGFLVEISSEKLDISSSTIDELVGGKEDEYKYKLKNTISNACNYLKNAVVEISDPDEINIEFGIKFGGEGGIPYITKVTGESSIKVSSKWNKKESS
jgi:hypothetical protein